MWGRRKRQCSRKNIVGNHSLESIKENIVKTSEALSGNKPSQIKALKREISELRRSLLNLQGRSSIREYRAIDEQITLKRKALKFIVDDKHIEEFVERVTPLLSESKNDSSMIKQQKQTVYLDLFYSEKAVPCFVDRDTCPKCNTDLVTMVQESMNICPTCGLSEHLIYCSADFIQNEEVKNTYDRGPLYRKFLMQHHEDQPDPPAEVINIVYRHLSKVHIMLTSKVKPTPITQILRQENLQKWAGMSVRIAKIINHEPIVKFSTDLINRLVQLFDDLPSDGKKTMNFEYLTNKFLLAEKEAADSEFFKLHKTRIVLSNADSRLNTSCEANQRKTWKAKRSC